MNTLKQLGCILYGPQERDAVHVAVAPVIAGGEIHRAAFVGFNAEGKVIMVPGDSRSVLGISDPWIREIIQPGQQFYIWLKPNTITDLKHVWMHPKFPDTQPTVVLTDTRPSVEWLTRYAGRIGESYEDLIGAAGLWVDKRVYWAGGAPDPSAETTGSSLEGVRLDEDFWIHFQIVTGITVPEEEQDSFFTCRC